MTDKEPVAQTAKRAADRRKRQAAALRANLKRRKDAQAPSPAPDPDEADPDS